MFCNILITIGGSAKGWGENQPCTFMSHQSLIMRIHMSFETSIIQNWIRLNQAEISCDSALTGKWSLILLKKKVACLFFQKTLPPATRQAYSRLIIRLLIGFAPVSVFVKCNTNIMISIVWRQCCLPSTYNSLHETLLWSWLDGLTIHIE